MDNLALNYREPPDATGYSYGHRDECWLSLRKPNFMLAFDFDSPEQMVALGTAIALEGKRLQDERQLAELHALEGEAISTGLIGCTPEHSHDLQSAHNF